MNKKSHTPGALEFLDSGREDNNFKARSAHHCSNGCKDCSVDGSTVYSLAIKFIKTLSRSESASLFELSSAICKYKKQKE